MRNRKGFTLVELLGVLILLAVVGVIAVPTVNNLVKGSKNKARSTQIKTIENAAKSWASQNTNLLNEDNAYFLPTQTLVDENYIEESNLVDPKDDTKILNQCVRIHYDSNYSSYTYTYSNCKQNIDTSCFTFDSVNRVITGYNFDNIEACPMDVTIPDMINGVKVVYIGPGSFNGIGHKNKITSVDFSKATYLRRIYKSTGGNELGAFANNLITYVNFGNMPEFYEIGDYAFYNNDLESIDFTKAPALKNIENSSFEANQLVSVNLSNLPVLQLVDDSAFAYNNISGELIIENSPLLYEFGDYLFYNNNITSLVLNNLPELIRISSDSFGNNLIRSLKLNNLPKLAEIRSRVFQGNNITTFVMGDLPSLTYIGYSTFFDNPIKKFDFSKTPNLTFIYDNSFQNCELSGVLDLSMLTKLNLIGSYAFSYNYYTSINWGSISALTTVGAGSFLYNSLNEASAFVYSRKADGTVDNTTLVSYGGSRVKVENVTIPTNVRILDYKAFRYCNIKSFAPGSFNNLTSIANGAFTGNELSDEQAFIYKKNSDASYDYTTVISYGGDRKENIKLPSTIKNVDYRAFYNCDIESIDLTTAPNLTTIGVEAFLDNYITSITIPATVTTIGDNAFYKSSSNQWNNITILGTATRFNSRWTTIGFPTNLMP